MCGVAGAFRQPDGQGLVRHDDGPDPAPGTRRRRRPGDRRRAYPGAPGHRRLSIIDLSAAADQPFVKDGLTLSYNGELYNYKELRRAVARRAGVRSSPTPTPRSCWRPGATGAPDALRAVPRHVRVRPARRARPATLLLARDPLGIKPLYVMPSGDGVLFASELKAIVPRSGRELRVDPRALVASTLYYWVPEEFAAIEGVRKLPAGSWADCGVGRHRTAPHVLERRRRGRAAGARGPRPTSPPSSRSPSPPTWSPTCRSPRFLSGGLDSSIVTALAAGTTRRSRPTRSPSGPRTSGWRPCPTTPSYARKMAAHLGIRLHEIEISPDIVDLLPRMVDALDEPIGDPAAINTVLMCQAARDAGVKVLLSGMGADELFGGYRKHLACLLGAPLPGACPRPLRGRVVAPAVRPAAGRRRRAAGCGTAAGPSAS